MKPGKSIIFVKIRFVKYCFIALFICFSLHGKAKKLYGENAFPGYVTYGEIPIAYSKGWMFVVHSLNCAPDKLILCDTFLHSYKQLTLPENIKTTCCLYNTRGNIVCGGIGEDALINYSVVYTIDTSGRLLWIKKIDKQLLPDSIKQNENGITQLIPSINGGVFVFSIQAFLARLDSSGTQESIGSFPDFITVSPWKNGFLATTLEGIEVLDTVHHNSDKYLFDKKLKLHLIKAHDDSTVFISNQYGQMYILKYTLNNFSITDSFSVNRYFNNAPNVFSAVISSGFFFYCGNTLICMDTKHNVVWKKYLPGNELLNGAGDADKIIVTGRCNPDANIYEPAFYKVFDINGNTDSINRSAQITGFKIQKIHSFLPADSYYYTIVTDGKITFKNTGDEMIDSLYVVSNGPLSGSGWRCMDNNLIHLHGLSLKPGDTVSKAITLYRKYDSLEQQPLKFQIDFNFRVEAVNGKLDKNDSVIAYSVDSFFTAIKTPFPAKEEIPSIFPNPVSGNAIQYNGPAGCIQIMDSRGIIMITAEEMQNFDLNISSLKPGIYFLHIRTSDACYSEKIVRL